MTHIRGNHTVRAAIDNRNQFRTGGGGGNTSGNFGFNQQYVRRNDDSFTPASDLGLGWAAFILGVPNSATVATNDTYALYNPYYGWFVQDSWRVTRKLTLNLGLRMEYEQGATERYNRAIVDFDPALTVPIAAGAQAAYARNPVPELPASQFRVIGGSRYAGVGGNSRRLLKNELMYLPRIGAAYALDNKTVIRAGYGTFFRHDQRVELRAEPVRLFAKHEFDHQHGFRADVGPVPGECESGEFQESTRGSIPGARRRYAVRCADGKRAGSDGGGGPRV